MHQFALHNVCIAMLCHNFCKIAYTACRRVAHTDSHSLHLQGKGLQREALVAFHCSRPQQLVQQPHLVQAKLPSPDRVHIDQDAVLYINHADVQILSLDLKGALVVEGSLGANITIDGLKVDNEGWEWHALTDNEASEEHQKIR